MPNAATGLTMKTTRHAFLLPALVLALMTLPVPAYAYLDPGTGSMILSAIIGLFATAALAVKTWWYRIKALFRRQGSAMEPAAREPAQSPDERKPTGGQ
jgi:hypothetical protein